MAEHKHTPGPWWVDHRLMGGCLHIYADGGRIQVARVNGRAGEQEANAALISAAPKLLAACETGRDALDALMGDSDIDGDDSPEYRAMRAITAAIAAAKGGEQ